MIDNFFVLEGLDGAGTTTQMKAVAKQLAEANVKCFTTAEPTSGETGKLLRRCLSKEIEVPKSTMAYLFAADRHEHIYGPDGVVEKARHGIVLCDRYLYSSFAYQGDKSLLPLVAELNQKFPTPELVIWLDVPPEECMRRIAQRDGKREIYENLEYLKGVRERYADLFSGKMSMDFNTFSVMKIDGTLPKDVITKSIMNQILSMKNIKTHAPKSKYEIGR